MRIHIKLVGNLAKSGLPNGNKGGEFEVAKGTTLAKLQELLQATKEMEMLIAVNSRVESENYLLQEGDIVQFAPPIAGG